MQKRGLSMIVATLLIVLLVLVALGIVWVVVRNVIGEGAGGIGIGRFTLDFEIKAAYLDEETQNIATVIVERSPGKGQMLGLKFIFLDGENSESVDKMIVMGELDKRTFTFDLTTEVNLSSATEVSIAPFYESEEGQEMIGDIVDTAEFRIGAPPVGNGDNGEEPPPPANCGNSVIDDGETCDDGGTTSGDGCSSTCQEETGWTCTGEPSVCTTTCGDTIVAGDEECDSGVNCDMETPDECTCNPGFTADPGSNGCIVLIAVDIGTIEDAWPTGAQNNMYLYFGSSDLPTEGDLTDMFVRLPDSSTPEECVVITVFLLPQPNYPKSHVGFSYEIEIPLPGTDQYEVWATQEECLDAGAV